ncbi:hypothetical protein [Atopococcus tabaci]|uniref:hypothetical protein n=1 Tax=Atopococcus tabaci TaxID=269774 RepID=UPI0004189B70|nr:hypothetical protein [Atopococcus tabaci]
MTSMQLRILRIGLWAYGIVTIICIMSGILIEWSFLTGVALAGIGLYWRIYIWLHKKAGNVKLANGMLFIGILLLTLTWPYIQ